MKLVIAAEFWKEDDVRYFECHMEPLLGDDVERVGANRVVTVGR